MLITTQIIVFINKKFASGVIINDSLDFAVKYQTNKIFGNLPHMLRALLADHAFEDGNKRTAAFILINYFEENNMVFSEERISKIIRRIAQTHPSSIEKIRSMIKYAIQS